LRSVDDAYAAAMIKLPTPQMTRAAGSGGVPAAEARGRVAPKLRYAHQGGSNPPIIVIHGNALQA
jgi:GTP-binding protein